MDIPLNVEVRCSDGAGGKSTVIIVHPGTQQVTHFVVDSHGSEYLVPIGAIAESGPDHILLQWSLAELAQAEPFVKVVYVGDAESAAAAGVPVAPAVVIPATMDAGYMTEAADSPSPRRTAPGRCAGPPPRRACRGQRRPRGPRGRIRGRCDNRPHHASHFAPGTPLGQTRYRRAPFGGRAYPGGYRLSEAGQGGGCAVAARSPAGRIAVSNAITCPWSGCSCRHPSRFMHHESRVTRDA